MVRACELSREHIGWYIEVNHVKGILKVVLHESDRIKVYAQDPKSKLILGDNLSLDQEVHIEKTLEEQVRDDVTQLKNSALNWLRKKIR